MANESKFSAVKNFPKRAQNTHRLKDWRCIRQMFQHFQFSMKNFCKFIIVWFCLFVGFSIVRYFLNVFCCCMCVSTHLIYSFYLVRSYQNWHIPFHSSQIQLVNKYFSQMFSFRLFLFAVFLLFLVFPATVCHSFSLFLLFFKELFKSIGKKIALNWI